ncbi:hypothetical protein ARMSODRAFT_1025955 [Armillaria solidipes]|uniref:F-box domain-containing protein n=1 Tax=Armillaria solidipes TaxID=1076256 RepID=A0A2H3AWE6_9AGAR|nr:hypothetical protein ARMSODRAFT_1025955 [Armillaria solidipes]
MNSDLYDLPDDVLIYKFTFFSIPDILQLRQMCQRFNALTRLPIVWTNAFKLNILANNYPFGAHDINIEHRMCHAYRLASRWLTDSPLTPKSQTTLIEGPPAHKIKFVPGHRLLIVSSKPSVLMILDITSTHHQKCSEWSLKDEIITMVTINEDPKSEGSIAVSFLIVLLHLDKAGTLHQVRSIDMSLRPVTLSGDIIALDDEITKTVIYNWKTDEHAYLVDGGDLEYNNCHRVIFTPSTILVTRESSIHLYTRPPLLHKQTNTPIAMHSFGWVEFISIPTPAPNNPLSILIRSESYDLRTLIKLYFLDCFPPILTSTISSRHGAHRSANIILGKRGTAVWICARQEHDDDCETLVAAVYPGPLNPTGEVHVHDVCSNPLKNWTLLDYNEELGKIVLKSKSGRFRIVQL